MPANARSPVRNNHNRSNFFLSSLADPPVVTFLNCRREFKNLKRIEVVVVFDNGYGTKA
jgi:hypothetical protein